MADKPQRAYALAKVLYEAVVADFAEQREAMGIGLEAQRQMDDQALEAAMIAEEELAERLGKYKAREALVKAEEIMVRWSIDQTARVFPDKRAMMDDLYERVRFRPALWDRLVEKAFLLKTTPA